jgi:peroxiredoxin
MEAYRDQYAKLFNNGRNVVVLAVSVDADTALASWARDLQTPVLFASDVGQTVGKLYGSTRGAVDNRSLFVIDPSGRIVKRMQPFNELAQTSYDELQAAVQQTLPATGSK